MAASTTIQCFFKNWSWSSTRRNGILNSFFVSASNRQSFISEFLRALPEVNHRQIACCADELKKTELPPLGGAETKGFFQRLIQGVFPTGGQFVVSTDEPKDSNPTIYGESQ